MEKLATDLEKQNLTTERELSHVCFFPIQNLQLLT